MYVYVSMYASIYKTHSTNTHLRIFKNIRTPK